MLALESDEDKTREGNWKHFVTAKSFRGFKCYMEGRDTLTFGKASAEPSAVTPTCTSCFPPIVRSLREELAKYGQGPALSKCWNTQRAGGRPVPISKCHLWLWKRRLYQDCRHGTEGQMYVLGVRTWGGGCSSGLWEGDDEPLSCWLHITEY